MSSENEPKIKENIKKLFDLINLGNPNPSAINDTMLRGLVREFQEQYNFKYDEQKNNIIRNKAKKDIEDLISSGGAALLPAGANALLPESEKERLIQMAYDNMSKKDIPNVIKENITLTTNREFAKVVKRLSYALQEGYFDANRFLIWAIALSSKKTIKYDLLLISLILRFGKAEPNMYLLVPEYGNVHILVYVVLEMEKKLGVKTLLNIDNSVTHENIIEVLLLLTLWGSKSSSLAIYEEKIKFDNKGLPQYDSRFLKEASKRDKDIYKITVEEWLQSKKYRDYGDYRDPCKMLSTFNNFKNDNNNTMMKYGLLLDNIKYAFPNDSAMRIETDEKGKKIVKPSQQPDIFECIIYNSPEVAKNLTIINVVRSSESDVLRFCIDSIALELFENCLLRGFKMSYFTMNRLCLKFKENTSTTYKRVDSEVYLKMLLYCSKLGVRIDQYQFGIIKNCDSAYLGKNAGTKSPSEQIKVIYEQPLFQKVCSTGEKAPLPKSIILIADSLGALKKSGPEINPVINKRETCQTLFKIFNEDPERVKEDAMNRIKDRIRTTAYTLADFTSGPIPIECENIASNIDPLTYVDSALAFYRDEKNSKLYCFPSFMYEDLQASDYVNPITGRKISTEAKNMITSQLETFKKLNINPNKVMPVDTAADLLKENDKITNDNTKFAENTIINMFQARGVIEATLKIESPQKYNQILKIVGMCQGYLGDLPDKSHQFATFCKALYSYLKRNISDIPRIMDAILYKKTLPYQTKSL